MIISEKISKTIKVLNEDLVYTGDNYAYVLDGATSLGKKINGTNDANWYVRTFSSYLSKYIKDNNAKLAVKKSIKEMSKEIEKNIENRESNLDIPSSCIALMKENEDNYEFFVLGDCSIIYGNKDHQTLITKYDIRKLDDEKIEKMRELAKEKGINVCDTYEYILPDLIQQRMLRNRENGYYALDVVEEAVDHAEYIIVPKDNIDMILLMSDGFSSYYDCLNIEKDYKSFFLKCYETSLEKLYEELRKVEKDDYLLNKHPRFKETDDASIIKIHNK